MAANPDSPSQINAPFPVVGIVASAGGLEAFSELISHLPIDTGMAFVLVQHLSPDYESLLPEIINRVTAMAVHQVEDQMRVEANTIYVIPPNTDMTLGAGRLHLTPRQKIQGKYAPGNVFFESLAATCGHQAIGVVLSGMDGDGAQGLKAIKIAGGVTFAQCEVSAKFDSMPNTAVATGSVDFVLPPAAIATELSNLGRSPFLRHSELIPAAPELPEAGNALAIIFAVLRTTTGIDFSAYKPTTLNRRMQRRMLLYKIESLEEYAQYLQAHLQEVQALGEEILIHVTSFFRDPEVFEQLKTQVFPTIAQNKAADAPIRIWVAGCSTGEEAYSIAICLLEFFSARATVPPIQIFATDISDTAIQKARSGFFLDSQMVGLSPDRRDRFFVSLPSGGYQISSAVRELCVFARHNLGGDPPFSNLDLISCRNVLIYLSDALQERIISLFHYSLNLTGFLLLGASESVKTTSGLFVPVHEAAKIYARKLTLTRSLFAFTTSPFATVNLDRPLQSVETHTRPIDLAREVDQLISNRYAPVFAIVNEQMQILQLRGDTDPYLKLSPGSTELNLLRMAREGLATPLRTALYQAQSQNTSVRQEHIQIEAGDRSTRLNLEVIPFQPSIAIVLYFVVIFSLVSPAETPLTATLAEHREPEDLEREIIQLRQALAASTQRELSTQAHLQAVIQEHSYLNQSLRVANEEIISSNEELQSTNEELQTAKEEIQATNEELATTNDELRSRNLQQNRDNSDLNNFIDSISVPILMLTNDLHIRRFTPTAQRLFNFIAADVGRPFHDLRTDFDVTDLEAMAREVLETLNTKNQEIQTQSGCWYSLRIRPYRTTENQIDGVTMVFLDIDALKRHATTLEAARKYAETIVETVQIPLVVLDADLRINRVNQAFCHLFQVTEAQTQDASLLELGNGQWNTPQLRSLLEALLLHDCPIQDVEVTHRFEQTGQKNLLLNACKLPREDNADLILLAIADITERQQLEAERLARQLAEIDNRAKDEFLSNLSHELRNPLNTMLGWAQILRTRELNEAMATRAVEVIERSAKAQSQLIEDILDISRITSGKLRLNRRLIDLRLVTQAAIETVQLSVEAKQIKLVSQLSSVSILGDVDRLQQVLWNLLSNSIKFTPCGGQIVVTLEPVVGQAQIQVADTGQGIATDLLPHIFDRFRQGDSSTTKAKPGLGLGLSIVRHLIELHGGTIQAQSPGKGQGATFTIRLPLRNLPPTALATAADTSGLALDLTGLHILVVDDEVDTCELSKFVLEGYGAKVLSVSSAQAALSTLMTNPKRYDVLVCDIGMPEQDGYWLMWQVRLLDAIEGGEIPAIALTAYASDSERQLAIEAGFQTHATKPIDPVQLALRVATLVGRA